MGLSASQARMLMLTARQNGVEANLMSLANDKLSLSREAANVSKAYSEALDQKKLTWNFKNYNNPYELQYTTLMKYNSATYNPNGTAEQYIFTSSATNRVLLTEKYASILGGETGNPNSMTCSTDAFVQTASGKALAYMTQEEVDFYVHIFDACKDYGWQTNSNLGDENYLQDQITNGNISFMKYNTAWNTDGDNAYTSYDDPMWMYMSSNDADSPMESEEDDEAITKAEADYDLAQDNLNVKETKIEIEMNNLDTERAAIETEKESVQKIIDSNIKKFKMFENA